MALFLFLNSDYSLLNNLNKYCELRKKTLNSFDLNKLTKHIIQRPLNCTFIKPKFY